MVHRVCRRQPQLTTDKFFTHSRIGHRSRHDVDFDSSSGEDFSSAPCPDKVVGAEDYGCGLAQELRVVKNGVNGIPSYDTVAEFDHDTIRVGFGQAGYQAFRYGRQALESDGRGQS